MASPARLWAGSAGGAAKWGAQGTPTAPLLSSAPSNSDTPFFVWNWYIAITLLQEGRCSSLFVIFSSKQMTWLI